MEPDDFEQIVSEHYKSLYRFAFSVTRSEADAQDLTQQAFYVWAMKGHQLRDRSKARNWLFTTLHRGFLEKYRKQQRFPQCDLEEIADEESPFLTFEPVNTADYLHVLQALARLDEVYHAAVALFYLEDFSYPEISEILRVPVGTVKSRISRGIVHLRQILESQPGKTEGNSALVPLPLGTDHAFQASMNRDL